AVVIGEGVARKLKLCQALKVPNCVQAAGSTAAVSTGAADAPADIAALSALAQGDVAVESGTRIEMLAATAHGAPNV
ncbi:hypothetical protein, partial [Pseudomonas sp. AB12(2023)]